MDGVPNTAELLYCRDPMKTLFRALEKAWRSKAARYFVYCVVGAIAVVVAAALILPAFLDLSTVEAEIKRKLSDAVHGEVAWEALRVRLLPSPRGALRGVRLEVPGVASVRAEEAEARLSLLPLFRGRAEINSVSIMRPTIRIDLAIAESAPPAEKAPPMDPVAGYRSALVPAIEAIRRIAPDILISVEDADVDLRASGVPPIQLSKLSVHAQTDSAGMEFEMTAASNYWSRLRFTATVAFADLSGNASLDVADIKPQAWLDRYLPKSPVVVAVPVANLRAQARTDGKTSLECDIDLSAGPMEILRAEQRLQVPNVEVKGKVNISRDTIKVERAAVSMLDARAVASATIVNSPAGPQITGSVSEGSVGGKFLEWVRPIAHLPPKLELKTPIQFAAQRIVLSPKQALEVEATAQFDAGPGIAVELSWAQDALDLRRLAIKDERSDATIALRSKGRAIEGKFSGSLYSTSIAAMMKSADLPSGSVTGNLHVKFDRDRPGRGTAEGSLKGESLDLSQFLGRPVKIDRIDLAADNTILRVREASVNWAGQRATLRGDIRRGASGAVIDAKLDSPGVVVDAILPPEDEAAGEKAPADKGEPSPLWPLPVTGRVAVRLDFLQRGRYKLAAVAATLVLEERRAQLDLKEARLCGISLPLTIEATPQGVSASARFTAQKQSLEQTARCLSDEQLQITGDFDLKADVRSKGKLAELARNLEGSIVTEARDGRVMKFALIGKILSMENISALLKSGPKLDQAGFPYRNITVNGRFQAGRFIVDEAAFRSDAVGLAATGWVSILDYQSRLSVLVAPLGRLDAVMRKVPIVGYVVGGALTSVPVGVSGDIRNPVVVPLGPRAITSELTGIFERTLKVPSKLLEPLKAGPTSGSPPDTQ